MLRLYAYEEQYQDDLIRFLKKCLPQSGRCLDLKGRHDVYLKVEDTFEHFWCLYNDDEMIGTVALKRLDSQRCELKSLYLAERYQGIGLGSALLKTAIKEAEREGYAEMLLDTLATSKRALALYEKMGFVRTDRYNDNRMADIFMRLQIKGNNLNG